MHDYEIENLLGDMSLEEKIGQTVQVLGDFLDIQGATQTGPAINMELTPAKLSLVGSVLGVFGAKRIREIQSAYMEHHPHHIPLLFMQDVIHGYKTIFPAPIGLGASFEPTLFERCAKVAAAESAAAGLHVTFSPMADLVRDARWGRVMESTGEDPYLNGLYTASQVVGYQGESLRDKGNIGACIKHFAGYGAPVGGREYNTVELSEHTFREFYLLAYQQGILKNAAMVMTSFNTIDAIPASVNKHLLRDILRKEMGFDGVLISDYSAIEETIAHGYASNKEDATLAALEAGVDIDMMSTCYLNYIKRLIQTGRLQEETLDESVLRILKLKNSLGLFENPFKDADEDQEKLLLLCQNHRNLAKEAAIKSAVLLKNEGILPLNPKKKIAFIGPYSDCKHILSSWAITGDAKDCVTLRAAVEECGLFNEAIFLPGAPMLMDDECPEGFNVPLELHPCREIESAKHMVSEAVEAARKVDTVVLALGECYLQSGEGASRANLDLPKMQRYLLQEVAKVNPNIVVVLFGGRPLDLREVCEHSMGILEAWLPGSEGGHALLDILIGTANPSGKLSISFPYCVGQVPVYYNDYSTTRPYDKGTPGRYFSKYIDIPNEPLFPFGYGLSYTTFEISNIVSDKDILYPNDIINASVQIQNTGAIPGEEVVQLYIQDVAGSVVRPVKELKGFKKIILQPGECKSVSFKVNPGMLVFRKADGTIGLEEGRFRMWIGNSSASKNMIEFWYRKE